ncbi:MAG: PKD domain-containing protein [Planctomycetota bacterium]
MNRCFRISLVMVLCVSIAFTFVACGDEHAPPIAIAGGDRSVATGSTVQLFAGRSWDPHGLNLTYYWTMTSKPAGSFAALDDRTIQDPEFTTDVDGVYVITLVVDNGTETSDFDTVYVYAS